MIKQNYECTNPQCRKKWSHTDTIIIKDALCPECDCQLIRREKEKVTDKKQ